MKDKSKLTRKTITNKKGHKQTVWVKVEKKLAKKNVGSETTKKLKKLNDWIEKKNSEYLANPTAQHWEDWGKTKSIKLSPEMYISAVAYSSPNKKGKLGVDLEVWGDYENEAMNLTMKDLPKAMAKLGKQHEEYLSKKKAGQPHYTDYENALDIIAEHNDDKSEEWVETQLDRAVNNILSPTLKEKDLTEKHYKNLLNAEFGITPKKYKEYKETVLQDREAEDEIYRYNNPS